MNKRDFPKVHFYDQDFVDIYDKAWSWLQDFWQDPKTGAVAEDKIGSELFLYPQNNELIIDQFESIFASFFLVYSNRNFPANQNLDYLYSKQEESGAIRWKYNTKTGEPVISKENPEGVGIPLFAWVEYNLYHKSANKKRIKEVMPVMQKYMTWLEKTFKCENGLYTCPEERAALLSAFCQKRLQRIIAVAHTACTCFV